MNLRSDKQSGLSLVELLIAMTASLFLLAGVLKVFLGYSKGYSFQSEISNIADDLRFAMSEIFYYDIRMSGFPGCVTSDPINHLNTNSNNYDPVHHGGVSIWGWEYQNTGPNVALTLAKQPSPGGAATEWLNVASPGLPNQLVNKVVPQTDVLVISAMHNTGIQLAARLNAGTTAVNTTQATNVPNGAILSIHTDSCGYAEMFQNAFPGTDAKIGLGASGNTPGNLAGDGFKDSYTSSATVHQLKTTAYYIGQPAGASAGDVSLMSQRLDVVGIAPEEMIPNIENFQVLYGISNGVSLTQVDAYVPANLVQDWERVVAVRLSILARTREGILSVGATSNFNMLGVRITSPEDTRARFESNITVAKRNSMR